MRPEFIGNAILFAAPTQLIGIPFHLCTTVWKNQVVAAAQHFVEVVGDSEVWTGFVSFLIRLTVSFGLFFILAVGGRGNGFDQMAHRWLDIPTNLYLDLLVRVFRLNNRDVIGCARAQKLRAQPHISKCRVEAHARKFPICD
ncbi:hypothetical protein APX70_04836 [Pseudomonas syringae pv. maculicola]|uniref:Uncharacterized protein n=1 Tax=Pseudomonas syringae pv. maculicola TaxID=59511 RepID=A0A3M2VT96_PSEYM|nr:hypothetical protein APX70_04836 [Pseudomonas syringae pv. maculicola]